MSKIFNTKNISFATLALFFGLALFLAPHVVRAEDIGLFEQAVSGALSGLISALSIALLSTSSLLIWIAGGILEVVIRFSTNGLHELIGPDSGVVAVWKTFRDIANMMFIFILLYAAIGTILGLESINIKKMITRVIIVALLINFSFFFTKLAIDASNIVTVGFYNEIAKVKCGNTTADGIGMAFMCKMGLPNLFNKQILETFATTIGSGGWDGTLKILSFGVVGSIFILIAAFVFFASALLFLVRLVILIFLLMLSPFAFAATALPNDKYSQKWFDSLTSNCIVAPAYMMATWAVLRIMSEFSKGSDMGLLDAIIGGKDGKPIAGSGEIFFNYFILIAMMIGTLLVAKEFGAYGAGGAIKALDSARGWAQGKLGRGAVRGFGVKYASLAAADKAFGDTEFGKSYIGGTLRSITTGAATGYDFGSGKSVQKVDKERKEIQEKMTKDIAKDLEKKLDKGLKDKREKLIKDTENSIAVADAGLFKINNELKPLDNEIDDLRERINSKKEAAKKAGVAYVPTGEDAALKIKLDDRVKTAEGLRAKAEELKSQKKEDNDLLETTKRNAEENLVATKGEKSRWLKEMQKEKAADLKKTSEYAWNKKPWRILSSYKTDQAAVAKKLTEIYRGGGSHDIGKIIEEHIAESGHGHGEEHGGGKKSGGDAGHSKPAESKPSGGGSGGKADSHGHGGGGGGGGHH